VVSVGDVGTFTNADTFINGSFTAINSGAGLTLGAANAGVTAAAHIANTTGGLSASSLGAFQGKAYATGSDITKAYAAHVGAATTVGYVSGQYVLDANLSGVVQNLVTKLDGNLQTLRSVAQNLGTNVALLNTRLDFTKNYVDLLQAGSGKLTLADLNEEGANLLALQTRQQLGIQALSFAGQNEKPILSLFR